MEETTYRYIEKGMETIPSNQKRPKYRQEYKPELGRNIGLIRSSRN